MKHSIIGWPGKLADGVVESVVIGANAALQAATWFANINRVRILGFAERKYPALYKELDGGDKRVLRAFLDPESISNTYSLLGGSSPFRDGAELDLESVELKRLLLDALGSEATFDNSFVERDEGVCDCAERWFFINGIATSRNMARRNVDSLRTMFKRPFTLIHNPTQGLTDDLIESAMQKFTNCNTEPVARAFLEIAEALLDVDTTQVVVIAHSQGTIITSDVLDLIYGSQCPALFDRTNMTNEEFEAFLSTSSGTVKSYQLREMSARLREAGTSVIAKLQLYMFANGASRMCYLDTEKRVPHIESFANEHDIVTRLGVLARDDFHEEDLIRIDGSLFTSARYGHLLDAHYLPDFKQGKYELRQACEGMSVGTSIHDPVCGNPCPKHPDHVDGPTESKLLALYRQADETARPACARRDEHCATDTN